MPAQLEKVADSAVGCMLNGQHLQLGRPQQFHVHDRVGLLELTLGVQNSMKKWEI